MDGFTASRLAEFRRHADGLLEGFTGREWLVEKVRGWRANPNAKPFLLIQGGAGIGKSAFAAHLWRKQDMVTAIHFCIAGRGGTIEPLNFIENISDQLADKVPGFAEVRRRVLDDYASKPARIDSHVQTGDVASGGVVIGVKAHFELSGIPLEQSFELRIRRPLRQVEETKGLPPLLILIDALDEALTYSSGLTIVHLLRQCEDLPVQVRWLLTSRAEPKVKQVLGDLPVELLDATDPQHQEDVRRYIRERQDELAETARNWGMTGEKLVEVLGQKSEWNFLYLTGIWPDLVQGGILSPDELPVGLGEYYIYFLGTRLKTAGTTAEQEWATWGADLMEVLLALEEPVNLKTLSAFLGWKPRVTDQRLSRVAQVLSPALFAEGLYFRHHWSLVQFLGDRERAGAWWCDLTSGHRQIAERLLEMWEGWDAGLPGLGQVAQATYGTRHLVTHLLEGGWVERAYRLYQLEREEDGRPVHAWYAVHEWADTLGDFMQGLRQVWQAISRQNREAVEQSGNVPRLGDEIRCALVEASLHSLAWNIPPELLVALAAVREIEYDWDRAEALAGLAPHLAEEMLGEALAVAREIEYEEWRAEALVGLAPHLAQEMLGEALAAVREIRDADNRARALVGLAPHLAEGLLGEALAAVREIEDERYRVQALVGLAPHLAQGEREAVLEEALAAVREIRNEKDRVRALVELAPHLAQEMLGEALAAVREIEYEEWRAEALVGLAPHLADLPARVAYNLWAETLPRLAARTRRDLLADLRALTPLVHALGGENAISETIRAIRDVSRWWS